MTKKREQSPAQVGLPSVRTALNDLQKELIKLYGKGAPVLLIYGSYARGQAHSNSDVDVLLLYPHEIHPAAEIQRVSSILADLNLRYQVLISVLPTAVHQYQNSQEVFWKNVRREAVSNDRT